MKMFDYIIDKSNIQKRINDGGWDYTITELQMTNLIENVIEECCEAVCQSDPSEKMVLHEPYRTVLNNIKDRLYSEFDL